MRPIVMALAGIICFLVNCGKGPGPAPHRRQGQEIGRTKADSKEQECSTGAWVTVDRMGTIYFDGKKVNILELKEGLNQVKEAGGEGELYREDPAHERTAQEDRAMQTVFQAIINANLPVKFIDKDQEVYDTLDFPFPAHAKPGRP